MIDALKRIIEINLRKSDFLFNLKFLNSFFVANAKNICNHPHIQ